MRVKNLRVLSSTLFLLVLVLLTFGCSKTQKLPENKIDTLKLITLGLGSTCPNCLAIKIETTGYSYNNKMVCTLRVNDEQRGGLLSLHFGTDSVTEYLKNGNNLIKLCCAVDTEPEKCDVISYEYKG